MSLIDDAAPVAADAPAAPAAPQSWEDALSSLPEELRETAKPHYEQWGTRLSEADQSLERWKPFEELGLHDVDPESLGGWFEWMSQLQDPESAASAISALAESVGVDLAALAGGDQAAPGDAPAADSALQKRLDELEARLNGKDEEAANAQIQQETQAQIKAEWDEVTADHKKATGKDLDQAEIDQLKGLAKRFAYDSETPIKDAYGFIRELAGSAQNALVEGAPAQPTPAERGGRAATTAQPPDDFDEAERQMRERRAAVAA